MGEIAKEAQEETKDAKKSTQKSPKHRGTTKRNSNKARSRSLGNGLDSGSVRKSSVSAHPDRTDHARRNNH